VVITLVSLPDARGRVRRVTKRLIADLGCPAELVLDERTLERFLWRSSEGRPSNFGWLTGYVVRVVMPEVEFDGQVRAYANRRAVRIARDDGFDGIAGKPFLDQFHFDNGEGGELCLESWAQYRARRGTKPSSQPTA
jgi:hypothetical protein